MIGGEASAGSAIAQDRATATRTSAARVRLGRLELLQGMRHLLAGAAAAAIDAVRAARGGTSTVSLARRAKPCAGR
ncbi:hypothetical protein PSAC2689_230012 [Paraburkholderia sacchari]